MPTRARLMLLACCLSAPALAQQTQDDAGGPGGFLSALALAINQTTRDDAGGLAPPAAAAAQLQYVRVPKSGSTALKQHLRACKAVTYNDHGRGCLVSQEKCNSTQVHVDEPDAVVFGVIRAPCEHFDSIRRHLLRVRWMHLPNGQETTPMQLAQRLIALRRSGCSQASPEFCAAAADGPALAVQAFARNILREFPQGVRMFNHRVQLLPQAFFVPDTPWSRPVCYSSNRTVLARQVNRVFADAGLRCIIRPQALDRTTLNVNPFLSPRPLRPRVCRLIRTELYPEDAALYDKHCDLLTRRALR
jgi:hypothetical protein